ncbi:hypothetical protein F511_33489 [Dorcoceras hygrometricum]|uniref:Uncharacterized protein n=1 Tax=Dorcoceras hygrometricum TaxID=472368 RepID=A0A2Z7BYG4_9LAMI|nr:hypothetical protein F511_33489 [Dorcoceras hygrometricum]
MRSNSLGAIDQLRESHIVREWSNSSGRSQPAQEGQTVQEEFNQLREGQTVQTRGNILRRQQLTGNRTAYKDNGLREIEQLTKTTAYGN